VALAPENSHRPITYPAAILKGVKNQSAAEAFVAFLKGPEATGVFERIGFAIP
jgi:molybdate transport system substrate-binding protein